MGQAGGGIFRFETEMVHGANGLQETSGEARPEHH